MPLEFFLDCGTHDSSGEGKDSSRIRGRRESAEPTGSRCPRPGSG
jgi:hypothetical protein